jgi:hypothetical protein
MVESELERAAQRSALGVREGPMEVMVTCCAGLDAHQATVVACPISGAGARAEQRGPHVRNHPAGVVRAARLAAGRLQFVVMESTGLWRHPHRDTHAAVIACDG